ncbi:hypothetical protein GGR57DRAFT_463728, partial [Xylariaceae sp. FL1272]
LRNQSVAQVCLILCQLLQLHVCTCSRGDLIGLSWHPVEPPVCSVAVLNPFVMTFRVFLHLRQELTCQNIKSLGTWRTELSRFGPSYP